jgi:hypothetical protein
MLMSAGGQYRLTSAVGPADISVDWSTVNGAIGSVGPIGQPHPEADRWGPWLGQVKEKEKGLGSDFGPKAVGPAQGPTWPGLA